MTARKLVVVVALCVLLACHQSATDPQPAPHNADLPIHRAIRAISSLVPGQMLARHGIRYRPGSTTGPNHVNGTTEASEEEECNCVPFVVCAGMFNQITSTCQLPEDGLGVCCPEIPPPSINKTDHRLFSEPHTRVAMRSFSTHEIDNAVHEGLSYLDEVHDLESRLASINLTPAQGRSGLQQVSVRQSAQVDSCPAAPQCNANAKYRTIDGTCNNLANPNWGKSETAFQRILLPTYDNGVSTPRTRSVTNVPLPLERVVSSTILVDRFDEDKNFTLSVMQWAQFIDHDLTLASFRRLDNNNRTLNCCVNGQVPATPVHPECWPIVVPATDAFYAPKGIFCMNFIRTTLALGPNCNFGYAEQMNGLTHWLDGSNIYGATATAAARLRENQNGRLRVSTGNLLPVNDEACLADQRGGDCYHAGDSRVNQQPGLTVIHTIFHREHNRVAAILLAKRPSWSDEVLFQETRRIVVAEYQHILFNEWLPIIVGEPFMTSFGLYPLLSGYSYDYFSDISPQIHNEFATAAYRFGHSLVQGSFNLYGSNGQISQTIQLRDHFNSPHILSTTTGAVDMFARSFTRQAIQKFDSFVTDELTNHLFQQPGASFGLDLMSLNLHRGRDHGIATYNSMRVQCGLPLARTFADFNDQIPLDVVQRLSNLYAHPDDVDFFVGGLSEKPVSGGLLGWTFLCVVGDQFARLKKADRFYYELGGQTGTFTPAQLTEIRRASWARILCDNTNIGTVQPYAFRLPFNRNPLTSCGTTATIPKLNIQQKW